VSKGYATSFSASRANKKSDLVEVVEVVSSDEWPCDHVICLLEVLKCDFVGADEAIFQDVERPCDFIFYILWFKEAT
jgi:hypothetical protein